MQTRLSLFSHYTVIAPRPLQEDPNLGPLISDFKDYKNGVSPPFPVFGRDVESTENQQLKLSKVSKVHVLQEEGMYDKNKTQFNNTTDSCHLVYCEHYRDPSILCVLAILAPDAHLKARDNTTLNQLINIAERFHEQDPSLLKQKAA